MGGSSGDSGYGSRPDQGTVDWCASDHTVEMVNVVNIATTQNLNTAESGVLVLVGKTYDVHFKNTKHGELDAATAAKVKACEDKGKSYSVELSEVKNNKVFILLLA